ncbi:hypothetical protein [Alteromonas facilis]|uniref:hypothetical protein n=1 Tax=Alteromonas facilis TaxID=2048004 RepID=UPI0013DA1228|nr:hypothetical protein [Alteromonas facilis]
MLLLSILFTAVSLLFIYALMRDTGVNTPHARGTGTPQDTNKVIQPAKSITEKDAQAVM